jgi:hypothetical protein
MSKKTRQGGIFDHTTGERMGEYLHMLAQAPLGVEKTDRNWCNGLYRLYCLHPDDVELRLASSLSCEGAGPQMWKL